MRPMPFVTAAVLATLLAAPAALAASTQPDALVAAAGQLGTSNRFDRLSERVGLNVAVARAHLRRKNAAAAIAALEVAAPDAARVDPSVEGPLARPAALAEVGAAWYAAGQPRRGEVALIDANGVVPAPPKDAWRTKLLGILAPAGLTAQAEATGATSGQPVDRALMAYAARVAGNGKLAATRAGEALAVWRKLTPAEATQASVALAPALWKAGYPKEALEIAAKLPKSAWPTEVRPFIETIAAEPPPPAARKALDGWLEVAIERNNSPRWQDRHLEGELLSEIALVFNALKTENRPLFTMYAADERLDMARAAGKDDSDTPAFLAGRAAALVTIGDAFFQVGKGGDGTDRFARGERLAATLTEPGTARTLALQARVNAAVARARAGVPDEAVKSAVAIPVAYYRGLALLKVDELAPDAVSMLSEEGAQALESATK